MVYTGDMSNIKPCRQCGATKDHYDSIPTCCKDCWKARVTARRNRMIDKIRAYDRARAKLPHRKQLFVEKTRRMRREKPGLQRAHNMVSRKTRADPGWKPLRCERCGAKGDIEGHHDDYARPLDVMWLCAVCHAQRHKELNRLGLNKLERSLWGNAEMNTA